MCFWRMVLDWRKRQAERAGVKVAIKRAFTKLPKTAFTKDIREQKRDLTYDHIFASYWGDGRSVYGREAA